ncbi:phage head spike fiber domain-containing protein [Aeromonas salmonicida]|uniref:phage head spike fiber domain-containing protein n=1 Tax=Aeromonas salmonicida TaxID=645 RepID=UPI003D314539
MAGLWQRTGNVTVTNGSKTVTGFGTKWKTGVLPIQKGHAFYGPDWVANEVDAVVSDTEILLVEAYRGGTLANQPYKIDITRTSTISQFAADLAALVGKYRAWFDSMMTWLTGSGDVSILNPDTGASITLPSWKKVASEGEGQATRAKAEADKAAVAADQAVNVVRDSAMPLPDVWAPLVDNLRLITGKGKEIKVGDEVVASRWEFERLSAATERQRDGKLRLVPAGIPRYEGGFLVKERGSTNLCFPHDASSGCVGTRGTVEVTAGAGLLGETQTTKFREDNSDGPHYMWLKNLSGFTAGDVVSITVELVPLRAGMDKIQIGGDNFSAPTKATFDVPPSQIGKPMVITYTGTATAATARGYVWAMLGGQSQWQGDNSINFEVLSVQVEKGPPTSLIPTTTAAATRADESVWLLGPANSPGYGKSRTYALEFEIISASTTGYISFFCEGAHPTRSFLGVWNDGSLIATNDYSPAKLLSPTMQKRNVVAASFNYDGGYISLSLNGGPVVKSTALCTIKPGQTEVPFDRIDIGSLGGGGHKSSIRIRDFRQWNRASSDAQLRAIK